MEKKVEIPLIDNSEKKKELISRVENIVLSILDQISQRKIPKLYYLTPKPNISPNLMRLTDTNDPEMDDNDDNFSINSACSIFSPLQNQEQQPSSHIINYCTDSNVNNDLRCTVIDFANKSGRIRMSRMMTVLAQGYKHLISEQVQTKRSFYYELKSDAAVDLFKRQDIVDKSICHVANLLQCTTWDLGFIATAKGLVAGNLTLTFENDDSVNCNTPGGVLIPQIATSNAGQIVGINFSAVCIIVVEKESIFQKLLDEDCPRRLGVILITGKGYPDVATRVFVRMLMDKIQLPIFILVDANPHGFEIMSVYKYGSINLWWQNANLTAPTIHWIGFFPSEVMGLHLPRLPLSIDDKKKLRSLENRSYLSDVEREELKLMHHGKAEIESLAGISRNFLTSRYLAMKIQK